MARHSARHSARPLKSIIRNRLRRLILASGVLLYALFVAAPAMAGNSAVIFMYHRFGEGDYPSTSITIPQFEAHLAELKAGGYTVMPLPDMVDSLKTGTPLPDRWSPCV